MLSCSQMALNTFSTEEMQAADIIMTALLIYGWEFLKQLVTPYKVAGFMDPTVGIFHL